MSILTRARAWLGVAVLAGSLVAGVPAAPASAAPGDFASGFEAGDPAPTWQNSVVTSAGVGGYCCGLTGMQSATSTETVHGGRSALLYSGTDQSATASYSYNQIFDVNLPVTATTSLSYWVFPQAGQHLDVAVDLAFTDGTFLRNSAAVDQHGVRMHPADQGRGWVLYPGKWNYVESAIGKYVAGRTVDRILIGYDQPANTGTFRGFFDDIRINAAGTPRLSDYVETRRGSDSTSSYSYGNTFPGATVPHGFNFWTPFTNGNQTGWLYDWADTTVQGFGVSHEPSPWIGDYAQLQVMPMTGGVKSTPDERKSTFSHANEVATAHYYKTQLDTYGITVEMTPTNHAGVLRLTYPSAADAKLLFDTVDAGSGTIAVDAPNRTISGTITVHGQQMYFAATVDAPITSSGTVTGQGATSWVGFATTAGQQITLKMGTSFISVAQASANLAQEVGTKTFDAVRQEAAKLWDSALGTVRIEDASAAQKITFYSNLYRSLMYPNDRSEMVNGVRRHQSPYDGAVHDGQMYVNNGFWDTARAAWPLYTLLTPTKAGEMLDGFVNAYKQTGWTPRWSGPWNIGAMTGSNQDLAFADAYVKGIRNFDYQAAYASAVKNSTVYAGWPTNGRQSNQVSIFKGYAPTDVQSDAASWTLEDATNDFGISQMAQALGRTEDAAYFRDRSLDYVNLYSPSVNFFRGKQSSGAWRTSDADFKPNSWGCDFTEGAPWHYATPAPQDPQGMANLYGGRAQLSAKIDAVFSASRDYLPGCYGGVIHEMREAYDADMGQYAHANEPIHHMIYMYNYAGTPAKTQTHVRDALTKLYGPGPGRGYLGDEDNGQMSAWYVFSALGFYPARMGSTDYTIGAPLHPSATVTLENGRTLTVNAPGVSDTDRYIQSATLNGVPYTKNYLTHSTLLAGGTLTFTMGPNPSSWGTAVADLPGSITTGTAAPKPLADRATGGTLTVSGENPPGEARGSLVDDTSLTKWLTVANTATVQYQFAGNASVAVRQYTLTSADDLPGRDPKSWTLQGSTDGVTWVTLDTRAAVDFADRRQTRAFVVSAPAAYPRYRLQITGNHGAAETQLAEWELLG